MKSTLEKIDLSEYVQRQLSLFFPDKAPVNQIDGAMDIALERLSKCFSKVSDPRFHQDGEIFFNHLHGDQYAMFIYLLSNSLFHRKADTSVCEKLFCLNKALYGIDAFYEIELPEIFVFSHAVGTVLGRARYSNYFLVYQGCVVGAARGVKGGGRGLYPVLGEHLSLFAGSAVLGGCRIGENCKISANSVVINKKLGPNLIYR